jgi:outer membrane protein assembly factor BamB
MARLSVGEVTHGPPTAVGDSLIVMAGERSLTALDISFSRIRWRRNLTDGLSSSRPYLWEGAVLAGTVKGEMVAFRAADGLPRWSHTLQGVIRGIGTSEMVLYVGTQKGVVYAYSRPRLPGARR